MERDCNFKTIFEDKLKRNAPEAWFSPNSFVGRMSSLMFCIAVTWGSLKEKNDDDIQLF